MRVKHPLETFSKVLSLAEKSCTPEEVIGHEPPFVVSVTSRRFTFDFEVLLLKFIEELGKGGSINFVHHACIELTTFEGESHDQYSFTTKKYDQWRFKNKKFLDLLYRAVHSFAWEGVFEINDCGGEYHDKEPKSIQIFYTKFLGEGLMAFQQEGTEVAFVTTPKGFERIIAAARKKSRAYSRKRRAELRKQIDLLQERLRHLKSVEIEVEASLKIERRLKEARLRRTS